MNDATQCFVSYTRNDNDDFSQLVDELARSIANVYEAQTGNALNIFLDRDSIGWGEDWRGKIRLAIEMNNALHPNNNDALFPKRTLH